MDVTDLVKSQWLSTQDIKESPTRQIVILDAGTLEEVTSQKGEKYQSMKLRVSIDGKEKEWRLNRYALKKISERLGKESKEWVGTVVPITTMLMQGGKEGIVPVPALSNIPGNAPPQRPTGTPTKPF